MKNSNFLNFEEADNLQDMINYAAENMNKNPEIYPIESLYTHLSNNTTYYTNDKLDTAITEVLNR